MCCAKIRKKVIWASIIIAFAKVAAAFLIALKFGGSMTLPLIFCIILITLVTVLYEIARTIKCNLAILILVTCGYPLRLLAGLWCAIPSLFKTGIQFDELNISSGQIVLYLFSIAALGGFSATIPWVYEAFHQKRRSGEIVKKHYLYLFSHFEERYNRYVANSENEFYPLLENGKLSDCWNLYFLASIVLISLNIFITNDFNVRLVFLECISVLLTAQLCCSSKNGIRPLAKFKIFSFKPLNFRVFSKCQGLFRKISIRLSSIELIVFTLLKTILLLIFFNSNSLDAYISIGFFVHQILFTLVYLFLRCKFDPSFDFFKAIYQILVGPDTFDLLLMEKDK